MNAGDVVVAKLDGTANSDVMTAFDVKVEYLKIAYAYTHKGVSYHPIFCWRRSITSLQRSKNS